MFEGGQHHLRGEGGRRGRLVGYSPNQMGDKRECGGGRKGGMEEEEGAPTLTLRGQRKKKQKKKTAGRKCVTKEVETRERVGLKMKVLLLHLAP